MPNSICTQEAKQHENTSTNALHEKVVAMASVIEQGYAIGTDLLGREMFQR